MKNQFTSLLFRVLASTLLVALNSCTDKPQSGIIDETESIVAGQVVDASGNPVQGASVMLYGSQLESVTALSKVGAALPEYQSLSSTTDKDGRYQFKGNFGGKAYLKVDWQDSLGLLDSVDFAEKKDHEFDQQTLRQKGMIKISMDGLEAGNILWIPALNYKLTITEQTLSIFILAPPSTLVIVILKGEEVSTTDPVDVESGEETVVDPVTDPVDANTMVDARDGQVYPIVTIGTQVWMAANLNYGTLNTEVSVLQKSGEKYCQSNLETNCGIYGGLYQWHVAMNLADTCAGANCTSSLDTVHQGLCPAGWHVPDQEDYALLAETLGGAATAGMKMKLNNVGLISWDSSLYNDGNTSGFSANPSGSRYYGGSFAYSQIHTRHNATWWLANDDASTNYLNALLMAVSDEGASFVKTNVYLKKDALSIRCLKD